jgi:hypothetical protein
MSIDPVERAAREAWEVEREGIELPWDELSAGFRANLIRGQRAAIASLREPTPEIIEAMWAALSSVLIRQESDVNLWLAAIWSSGVDGALSCAAGESEGR